HAGKNIPRTGCVRLKYSATTARIRGAPRCARHEPSLIASDLKAPPRLTILLDVRARTVESIRSPIELSRSHTPMSRMNSPLVGLAPRTFAVGCAALLASACSSSSSPMAPEQQRAPKAPAVADFVYASDAAGTPQIYWNHNGTSTRLTFDNSTDNDPEIYISGVDGSAQTRLTNSAGLDDEAAIDPTGTHIVFTSDRSGVIRLFTMDVSGANQTALTTGSATIFPERAPAWSPDGSQIAFVSTRSGMPQVYV